MALPTETIGTTFEAVTATVDPDRAKQYAAATNDDNPAYASGKYAPPVFGVVPTWDANAAVAIGVVPPEAVLMIVHGEQDMWFHRPLVPDTTLTTAATVHDIRVGSSGTRLTALLEARDDDGRVLDLYVTTFIRGMVDGDGGGPDKPDHTFPEEARTRPAGELTVHLDADITHRYAAASGDPMPIHLDDAVARSVGLPGIIVHGLCTMAVCSQAVVKLACDGDPARLRRLAVRFARNVLPDSDVVVSLYEAGGAGDRNAYAFEAHSRGELVISNGRAEVGPA